MAQLHMIWPDNLLETPPVVTLEPEYGLRCFTEADETAWLRLMAEAGFEGWDSGRLAGMLRAVLPDGFFLVVHRPTARVVATAVATHNPEELHPYGGELGWVAADPVHSGHGLGRAVCSAVVARLLSAGYRRIYLKTDDFRLAALKVYLTMGFVPLLYAEDMAERWRAVYEKLGWEESCP